MQEEVTQKCIVFIIKASKLSLNILRKAAEKVMREMEKAHNQPKRGKQSVKQLLSENAGAQSIEITPKNIKGFDPIARKYGLDYALKKDISETPPKYLIFFKARDADALTAAFREFTQGNLHKRPSIRQQLAQAKAKIAQLLPERVPEQKREVER